MNQTAAVQERAEFEKLDREYQVYLEAKYVEWRSENPLRTTQVWEVMGPNERKQVSDYTDRWNREMKSLTEAWWRERGWEVVLWPTDDSKEMRVKKFQVD